MTSRFFCFTINNPDGLLDSDFEQWLDNGLRYAVYQHEVGENGTEHFQGYLELDRGQRFSYVKARLPTAHIEQRRGTQTEAIAYCKKEDSRLDGPWEFGTPSDGQGSRTDVKAFKTLVDSGASDQVLWDQMPMQFLRYGRMLPMLRTIRAAPRQWKTEVTLLYGPPGSGKSYYARDAAGLQAFWKQPNSKWFDGYNGQENVVLDDYKSWLPWATLLQLLDAYPMTVECKGAQVNWAPKKIWITTNWLPGDWYDKEDGHKYPLRALTRRIERFLLFSAKDAELLTEEGPSFEEFTDFDSFFAKATHFNN